MRVTDINNGMSEKDFFNALEHTGNHYSHFKRGREYVYFSTGGWSENEELISELRNVFWFHLCLVEWRVGGHYKFRIPRNAMTLLEIYQQEMKKHND